MAAYFFEPPKHDGRGKLACTFGDWVYGNFEIRNGQCYISGNLIPHVKRWEIKMEVNAITEVRLTFFPTFPD